MTEQHRPDLLGALGRAVDAARADRKAEKDHPNFTAFEERALQNPAVRAAYEDAGMRHFIADLLLAHQPSFQVDGDYGEQQWVECACDSEYFVDTDAGYEEHVQHQAAVLVERLFPPGQPALNAGFEQRSSSGDRP